MKVNVGLVHSPILFLMTRICLFQLKVQVGIFICPGHTQNTDNDSGPYFEFLASNVVYSDISFCLYLVIVVDQKR